MSVAGAPVFLEGRGKVVDMSRDAATGNWIAGSVHDARTPRFVQSDISLFQDFHVSKSNERLIARIGADCLNCLNQHHATIIQTNLLRTGKITPYACSGAACGSSVTDQNAGFIYSKVLQGYDYVSSANSTAVTLSSLNMLPSSWQSPRSMRFQVRFTF